MLACAVALVIALGQFGQANTGELRVTVTDVTGAALPGPVEVVSQANEVRQQIDTDSNGVAVVRRLPFGSYRVAVSRTGFADAAQVVEVRSALPTDFHVRMNVSAVQTQTTVTADSTLLDTRQPALVHRIGADTLQQRTTALPGRVLPDLVNTQPGWLLEANGILHPRGSEYQTQYVVDGLPLTDNRSPVFAPEPGADDIHSMSIMTAGYPAEYGRKLGGVIEVVKAASTRRGFGSSVSASLGSFDARSGDAIVEHGGEKSTISLTAGAATTDRYLDPPVADNFTNHGSTARASMRFERDLSPSSRVGVILRHGSSRFLVPNENIQQEAGQRQDRDSLENAAQFSIQRIFSSSMVGDIRGMIRNVSAKLWSNPESTPIVASQDRGFREFYLNGSISGHRGVHEWKAGADVDFGTLREEFAYTITDEDDFDSDVPLDFAFFDRRPDREQAVFIQDQIRNGPWTVNLGLRWDHYSLVVEDNAFSPRLAVAWSPKQDLVFRASYDRVFQTPAIENLLLASTDEFERLGTEGARLPVPTSRGNFFEAGVSRAIGERVRIDVAGYERRISDMGDDDVLLNTGVSFPIAFRFGHVYGVETKLDLRQSNRVAASVGYSFMRGIGELPVTGGLFLGEDTEELDSTANFPLTQDQRHTIRARATYHLLPSTWVAVVGSYGSGLPFEDFEGTPEEAAEQFGEDVLDRVNFETGRVKPNASLDVAGGVTIAKSATHVVRLQAEARNLTNRFDVINFAGLFSGTALAAPRSFSVRLRWEFQ
jgi:hypothetical protein